MAKLRIPVINISEVYHVGDMNVESRGVMHSTSLEGHCLSVSRCPSAWRKIARLGSSETYRLSNVDGVFVDMLALMKDSVVVSDIVKWAENFGLCSKKSLWRAWITDEDGEWRYILCDSRQSAIDEADCCGDYDGEDIPGPNGGSAVEEVVVPVGTQLLADKAGFSSCRQDEDATDLIALLWADEVLGGVIDVDGVWWNEVYDPSSLSAPRGGIFPRALESWNKDRADKLGMLDDFSLLSAGASASVKIVDIASPDDLLLYDSARKGDLENVLRAIDAGADVNYVFKGDRHNGEYSSETAMMAAARTGNLAVVRCLVERGADINLKAMNGHSALYLALTSGGKDKGIAEYLVVNGASMSEINSLSRWHPDEYGIIEKIVEFRMMANKINRNRTQSVDEGFGL